MTTLPGKINQCLQAARLAFALSRAAALRGNHALVEALEDEAREALNAADELRDADAVPFAPWLPEQPSLFGEDAR